MNCKRLIKFFLFLLCIYNFCFFIIGNAFSMDEIVVAESGVGNAAGYINTTDNIVIDREERFVKNDFLYFAPDDYHVIYWYKFNRAPFSSQFASLKLLSPSGEVIYVDNLLAISRDNNPNHPRYDIAFISLKSILRSKKIGPDQFGTFTIELYKGKKIVDKKIFFVNTKEKLIELAIKNNENPYIIRYLEDVSKYRNSAYIIINKDGINRFIFKGFPRERLCEELGQPVKIEKLNDMGKEKWIYIFNRKPSVTIPPVMNFNPDQIVEVIDNNASLKFSNVEEFYFIIEDGIVEKLKYV